MSFKAVVAYVMDIFQTKIQQNRKHKHTQCDTMQSNSDEENCSEKGSKNIERRAKNIFFSLFHRQNEIKKKNAMDLPIFSFSSRTHRSDFGMATTMSKLCTKNSIGILLKCLRACVMQLYEPKPQKYER